MMNVRSTRTDSPQARKGLWAAVACATLLVPVGAAAQIRMAQRQQAPTPHDISSAYPYGRVRTNEQPHVVAPIVRELPPPATSPERPYQNQISQATPLPRPGQQTNNQPGYQPRENSQPRNGQQFVRPGHPAQNQLHLNEWMEAHRGLPLDQQQRALQQEPGFNNLNSDVQQRMHNRLSQLNTMAPEKRQRVFARTEAMERLNPQQRQQVTGAMQQLGSLPEDRRMLVGRAFHAGLEMPDAQRQAWLNSPQTRSQFSDQERATLGSLFNVAPAASQAGFPAFQPRRQPPQYQPQP